MSELEDFKARVEILESAVDMLEQRLSTLMDIQTLEPYEIEISDEDAKKLKDWIIND
jgi:hypothetical protein